MTHIESINAKLVGAGRGWGQKNEKLSVPVLHPSHQDLLHQDFPVEQRKMRMLGTGGPGYMVIALMLISLLISFSVGRRI